jgi:hypothetical protein
MANIFAITAVTEDIKADMDGKATVAFTVTNTSSKPMRGIAKARPLGNTQQDWLAVEGETERDFSANGTQQFTVDFSKPLVPAAAGSSVAPEKFPFRLDVFSALNPDEQFTEGPTVKVEVTPPVQKPPPKPFPWRIILVVVGVLIITAGILFFVFWGKGSGKFSGTWVNANPAATPPQNISFVITKLEIEHSGKDLKIHAFNKCAPAADCDGGVATGSVVDGVGKVTLDHGIIYHLIDIKDDGEDKIKAIVNSTLRYGGSNQTAEFSFTKQKPPQ